MTRRPRATLRPGLPAAAAALLALSLLAASPRPAAAGPQIPYGDALGRAYDLVLDARFDQLEPELQRACGPAPRETCDLIRVTALWWRIQLDPYNTSLDAQFRQQMDGVIASMVKWTERDPRRADAWLFLGAAYGVRVQFKVLRVERLSAARDGKRIKEALERSLSLDPKLQDAYFGIGLYHYYADLGPAVLKLLVRFLFSLPGGNRVQGLREMQLGAERGELLRGEAFYQIALVDLWYEHAIDAALKILEDLRVRYPHNPVFIQAIAEVHNVYLHDHAASLEAWRRMLDLARQRKLAFAEMSEARARLGVGEELDELGETDLAIEQLKPLLDQRPAAPWGTVARTAARLGLAYDRLGQRPSAMPLYQLALAQTAGRDPYQVRDVVEPAMRRRVDARGTEAYRLSLQGWRQLQRQDLPGAEASLTRAATLNPADTTTRYRQARLMLARGQKDAALAALEQVLSARPVAPPPVLAASCVDAGRLVEEKGDRGRAIDLYRRALAVRGGEAESRRAAREALTRLGASSTLP